MGVIIAILIIVLISVCIRLFVTKEYFNNRKNVKILIKKGVCADCGRLLVHDIAYQGDLYIHFAKIVYKKTGRLITPSLSVNELIIIGEKLAAASRTRDALMFYDWAIKALVKKNHAACLEKLVQRRGELGKSIDEPEA